MRTQGFLGLDIGGTGAKAGLFDEEGRLLGSGNARFTPTQYPDGRAEIPIDEIYNAARDAVSQAVDWHTVQVVAMAMATQGQTFVSLDERGVPLHPAIMWYDARASEQADWLRKTVHDYCTSMDLPLLLETAWEPLIEPISTAPKILWLRQHYPKLMSQVRRYLLLPDYFSYRLMCEAVTDPSTAASSGLYADDAPGYSRPALEAAGISVEQLAEIVPSGRMAGHLLAMDPRWNLPVGDTQLVSGCNDQYAGAIGAGVCRPGIASETSGTCLAITALTEALPEQMPPGLIGGRFPIPQYQFALAYAKTSGLVLDWFRREFCPGMSLQELDEAASEVPPGSLGVTALPHFDGMVSPVPNPSARGAICNLSLGHGIPEIYRAVLESLAFNLRENIELMQASGISVHSIRAIGGGAKSDIWLQMKADITGLCVERPAVTEAATLGAAMLAAVGVGNFSSVEECAEVFCRVDRVFEPDPKRHELYQEYFKAYWEAYRKLYDDAFGSSI